jgi:lysophospholipase L1-like esterase
MKMRGLARNCCVVVLAVWAAALHPQRAAIANGETVVFYGDSITAQRFYTKLAEEFVVTRYPAWRVRFINAGVPGDTVYGGYAGTMKQRVARDVAPYRPGMITVMLGMNDGGYGFTPAAEMHADFDKGYKDLIDALHASAPDAAFTFIAPTPYDEVTHGTDFPGYSKLVDQLAEDVGAMAAADRSAQGMKVYEADFHAAMVDALRAAEARFPQLASLLIPDRIHPSEMAHWIMAAALMKAWGIDPVVTNVRLNAPARNVVLQQRTSVSGLQETAGGLRWTQMDEALPLPLDLDNAMTRVILDVSDPAGMDGEMLVVEGLMPGRYHLSIDKKAVGDFSSDELGRGVNLALLKTPMLEQARGVVWFEDRRAALDESRFVLMAEVAQTPESKSAEDKLVQAEGELETTMRAKLALKSHELELRREDAR